MKQIYRVPRRDGIIVPIVAVSLVALMGFVALAIDIGMMVVARTQAQNAADIAALAGARTLDGTSSNNVPGAIVVATQSAQNNLVLNVPITAPQVTTVQAGIYRYDTTAQRFQVVFGQTPAINEAFGAMQVAIRTQQPTVFANVLGIQSIAVGAVATAVHRPTDLAVVLDFSGSMAYCSQFFYPDSSGYSPATGSLNPDPNFPRFGPWSIWGGPGMVLDPNNPPATPANLNAYVPPTPMQRLFSYVGGDGQAYAANNLTTATRNGPAIVGNFLLSDNSTNAFVSNTSSGSYPTFTNVNVSVSGNPTTVVTPAPASFVNQNASGFVGDPFPLRSGVTVGGTTAPTPDQYAQTVADYLGISRSSVTAATPPNAKFEQYGYDWNFTTSSLKPASQRFQGFTMGPGYFGKTFYMWPPDPRTPVGNIGSANYVAGDWRQRFFLPRSGSTQDTRDNSMFWASNGSWQTQNAGTTANYMVNYNNVLAWLASGPQTLPPSLRAGRIDYYDSIPSTIPVDQTTGEILGSATAQQAFWKDYIDFVIGAGRYLASNVLNGSNSSNGNTFAGANLNYNNPTSASLAPQITPRATLVAAAGSNPVPFMSYTDNPIHPRAQFWFGPLSMLDYLQTRTYFPGTCYEAPCWQLKVGISAALTDIQNNHPNDMASLIFFSSSPGYSTSRVSMGKSYVTMQNALFYPYPLLNSLSSATATVVPYVQGSVDQNHTAGLWDNTDTIIPNSGTETCPQMAFMAAYNEFGWSTGSGTTYTGRQGAAKVVIFETDGVPNFTYTASFNSSGTGGVGQWYYNNSSAPVYNGTSLELHVPPKDNARSVVQQIVAPTTSNPPGFSTTRLPARVHAIAFGELFEPTTPSAMKPAALQFLTAVEIDGNTIPRPAGAWDNDNLNYQTLYVNAQPYKIITGTYQQRINLISQAMQIIMESGIQVSLIQ
jgi:Putative Flp pilus-assembly TadE/G-like